MFVRLLVLSSALMSGTLFASMDHYEPFTTLRWETNGGHSSITATQTKDGMTSLTVVAFGRKVEVLQKDLEIFQGFWASGLFVTGGEKHLMVQFIQYGHELHQGKGRFLAVLPDGTYVLGRNERELDDAFFKTQVAR